VCGVDVEVEKTEKFDGRCGQAVGSRCSLKMTHKFLECLVPCAPRDLSEILKQLPF
jgi:hypothetical protein